MGKQQLIGMNRLNIVCSFIVIGFIFAVAAAGHRYSYFQSQNEQCQIQKVQYSKLLCSEDGGKEDWSNLPGLVSVKVPPLNTNAEAYLLKKEMSDVSWVENPGWFGFKFNCILDRVVLVQNESCKFLN
jgi:hypothetical protein